MAWAAGMSHSAPTQKAHGQGKRVATLLAEQGHLVTVINDVPYTSRRGRDAHVPLPSRKGDRAMHKTTMATRTQDTADYATTSQHFFGGSYMRNAPERRRPYVSSKLLPYPMPRDSPDHWLTKYQKTYFEKPVQPPSTIRQPEFNNKTNMARGAGTRESMAMNAHHPNYWTQYKRTHGRLGAMLGDGVPRERPVRQGYNVLTGANTGGAWQPDNKRISGNRILSLGLHGKDTKYGVLG
ncbi:hypothetical protein NP493_1825g00009 [Ridgeia piscesae]|uniref:Uncharacterized protein n=1 Tax=Ridgeia piscesae TaxID=27915 RepID=A0AAD9JRZ4_RIDPI|nr:hypothetical protein NP493_1825g00009 [Ridgeia piscesae]